VSARHVGRNCARRLETNVKAGAYKSTKESWEKLPAPGGGLPKEAPAACAVPRKKFHQPWAEVIKAAPLPAQVFPFGEGLITAPYDQAPPPTSNYGIVAMLPGLTQEVVPPSHAAGEIGRSILHASQRCTGTAAVSAASSCIRTGGSRSTRRRSTTQRGRPRLVPPKVSGCPHSRLCRGHEHPARAPAGQPGSP